ncbi:chorismate synthase [Bacteroidota bacterium]|nr:chorismate synthase [Bacteroidota bacterium]
MAGNSIGEIFKVTTFGESHGLAVGAVIDGCPAGLEIDESFIQHQLDRRKPGQSVITTQRNESDTIHILSGVFEGKTLGTPICLLINNTDAKPQEYEAMKNIFRPSHADYTYETKYGIRDYRGGGRSSARVTAASVAAGAIAQLLLKQTGMHITAYVQQVGKIKLNKKYSEIDLNSVDSTLVRCPDEIVAQQMQEEILKTKAEGDSLGGIIHCVIKNVPVGLGEPVFDKLQADLAKAIFSINAVHGFEYGSGFAGSAMKGSEHNDAFEMKLGIPYTKSNFSGGIQGGISNGMDIYFSAAFKPTATISKEQSTINSEGEEVLLEAKGRHDPCVLPRAVPIVEAMTALVLADFYLRNKSSKT